MFKPLNSSPLPPYFPHTLPLSQLQKILSDPISAQADPFPVGALTSVNRDQWTDSRQALLQVPGQGGEQNKKSLERIQSSVIVLCLDDIKSVTKEEVSLITWTWL